MIETVVVFGSQRLAAIWALRHGMKPSDMILATQPERLRALKEKGLVHVVRVPPGYWAPATFPCEVRVRETEAELKGYKSNGGEVKEWSFGEA